MCKLSQVHLTVDTTLQDGKLAINVYVARVLSLGSRSLATEFQAVDYQVLSADLDKIGGKLAFVFKTCSVERLSRLVRQAGL